jgi:hypothetical protein
MAESLRRLNKNVRDHHRQNGEGRDRCPHRQVDRISDLPEWRGEQDRRHNGKREAAEPIPRAEKVGDKQKGNGLKGLEENVAQPRKRVEPSTDLSSIGKQINQRRYRQDRRDQWEHCLREADLLAHYPTEGRVRCERHQAD